MEADAIQQWFDPDDLRCKAPYGAVESGETVHFTIYPPRSEGFVRGILTAQWEFEGDRVTETALPWSGLMGDRDLFSGALDTGNYVGLIWYSFRLEHPQGG